jgi:hypothetical protein
VRVRDRPHDVLEPRALPDQLLAPGDLPPQGLRARVGDPDLRQEAAGVGPGQRGAAASMPSVLTLACAISRTCLGLAITTRPTCGASTSATAAALPVASTTTWSSWVGAGRANLSNRSRRMSTRPSRVIVPSSGATASAKTRWMSIPTARMAPPPPPCSW